ncbi:universal stress protein [Aquabacterium sp.]|uniref:universal stress protein n=1 Tax=Aquabacterium sp. TaxID=1872578 RepID=UPI00248A2E0E|nr:universal stress protein [Aquabacterium sp.]MDI1261291.1 universal stress protein [Aquabacterium sp.]
MKILMPVDGSEYTKRMLGYIAAHDELLGAQHEYTILTVVPLLPAGVTSFLDRAMADTYYEDCAQEVLRPIKAFTDQKGWNVQLISRKGHAADVVAEFAEKHPMDLIVMGTHGRSAFGNVVLGSVTTGVLARTKVPMLLVR